MWEGIKNRWIRATELADAARQTGKRGWTPEFGASEFLKGITGQELHSSDAADPIFQNNLLTEIREDVKPENREIFKRDFVVAGQQRDARLLAQAQAEAKAEADWIHETRNTPAAQAGIDGSDRYKAHLQHQDWKSHRKAGTLDEFAKKYPQSQTAKERAMNNRILTPMDMDY